MSSEEQDALDAMSSEFVAEIKDDLASLETDLLVMEEKGAGVDDDLINHAFRSIHSIKGGAGFLNFQMLSSLSHMMESVLMRVREKKLVITSEIVDALLSGFDKMKLMVENMGTDKTCDFENEKEALTQILDPSAPSETALEPEVKSRQSHVRTGDELKAAAADSTQKDHRVDEHFERLNPIDRNQWFAQKHFNIEKLRLDHALKSQKYLYAVCFQEKMDLELKNRSISSIIEEIKSIGDILYADPKSENQEDGFYCVIATILDLPLLIQVLEIEPEQISLLDQQFTDIRIIMKSLDPNAFDLPGKISEEKPETVIKKQKEPLEERREKKRTPAEHTIEPAISAPLSSQTIRVNVDLISRLMNRAGELVLSRNQLRPILESVSGEDNRASHMMQNLDMVTTDIQEAIMQMRMQPVIDLLGKYKRVVRDIARRISKKVELVIEGADVEMDRNILEKLANPVTHLIRNCIDHGIESPEDRLKQSKPEAGTIHIKAFHQGGHVHLSIMDDGAGIDPQLVLSKAFEKGLVTEEQVETLTDKQKINLIFLPGFSTSETITDISGRGVGMDVVKTNIERMRGQIEIESEKGRGTRVNMIIPLTLAIVPSLIVSAGPEKFAIPQAGIKEVIFLEPGQIHKKVEKIGDSEVLRLRESLLPIVRLRNVLGLQTYIREPQSGGVITERRKAIADRRNTAKKREGKEKRSEKIDRRKREWDATYVIILKMGSRRFGLCVDELYDIEEVVVEPLSEYIKNIKSFSGTTILGDGSVIMILDVAGIASSSSLHFESIESEETRRNKLKEGTSKKGAHRRNLIVFCNDDKEYFAIELAHISRLEPVEPKGIHHTGVRKYIEYHDEPVLLFSLEELIPASRCDENTSEMFAIFPKNTSVKVGILASRIIDTIEIDQALKKDSTCADAVEGKVFIKDMMVQVLNHHQLADLIESRLSPEKERR